MAKKIIIGDDILKINIFSLYWDNGKHLYEISKKVTDHFQLNVQYHNYNNIRHGDWMTQVARQCDADVIGFFDTDCVPTNRNIIEKSIKYVIDNNTFIGVSQVSNHIPPKTHVYAAPAFFFITKDCYMNRLNQPSFLETKRGDVAEELSYLAEEKGIKYKSLYPTHYERPSTEGVWNLGNYGGYAVGTHFYGGIYHLYQGRFQNNIDLFEKRCDEIINGKFSTEGMFDSVGI